MKTVCRQDDLGLIADILLTIDSLPSFKSESSGERDENLITRKLSVKQKACFEMLFNDIYAQIKHNCKHTAS